MHIINFFIVLLIYVLNILFLSCFRHDSYMDVKVWRNFNKEDVKRVGAESRRFAKLLANKLR